MSARPNSWPIRHHTLLPALLSSIADQYPSLYYAWFPRDPDDISKGYRRFTFAEVANAVNAFAWWIDQNVGKLAEEQKNGNKTLVYMGPNDIRYAVLCLGSVVAGYKMLFPSPRYGSEALGKLIETIDAKVLLSPETPYPVEAEILEKSKGGITKLQAPSVDQLFAERVAAYPFTKTFATCKDEPAICVHTSGTTGFPKPVLWTHDWIASQSQTLNLPLPAGFTRHDYHIRYQNDQRGRLLVTGPPFHASGIFNMVLYPLLLGTKPIYSQPGATPEANVDRTIAALEFLHTERTVTSGSATETSQKVVDCVSVMPTFIEYVAKHPAKLDQIVQRSHSLRYGGGSVSRTAGDIIVDRTHLVCGIGSTEQGIWPTILRTDDDMKLDGRWEYVTPHPALNLQFRPVSEDAGQTVYEAVMVRNNGEDLDGYVQPLFRCFPDLQEKSMGDLFLRSQKSPDMWKHHGRTDDLLVFLSNEKFFPTVAEQRIASHPGIAEALIVGTRRPKASLIVRLEEGFKLDDVWERIEEVNVDSPLYARVTKDMVIVAQEPFLKTAKGSVRKVDMLGKYSKELDKLYGEGF
ncbi:hypothetical protein COCVIDRAFT_35652 [Bipolaris victoriae FI3]|uniref:AMP-dependent synthetase/ligase domain-containing protein n=1 Tax=Bipolaris victoriae (strain FI3) TaxID=930091 RepID=W7EG10_BIPV3|nr:hypothetical protein COCVIDRAFT_35652 [Bipolaris victoriae FI3]